LIEPVVGLVQIDHQRIGYHKLEVPIDCLGIGSLDSIDPFRALSFFE
jgi:hypothetical protein